MSFHVGRAFNNHIIEDSCICAQEKCGLVNQDIINPHCDQHAITAAKSLRQSHRAEDCPALT
jgi:hypothetical protein